MMQLRLGEALLPFDPFAADQHEQLQSIRTILTRLIVMDAAYWEKYSTVQFAKGVPDDVRARHEDVSGRANVTAMLLSMGATSVSFFRGRGKVMNDRISSQAIVVKLRTIDGEERAIICPAGTNEPRDWLTNLNFEKVELTTAPGSFVHRGFFEYWISLEDQLLEAVGDLPFYIYGHSLAGGAGERGAMRCVRMGKRLLGITTAGGPRSADDYEAKLTEKAIGPIYDRLVFCCDDVPLVPPDKWGFDHSIDAWDISRKGDFLRTDTEAGRDRKVARLLGVLGLRWIFGWGGGRFTGIVHHLLRTAYLPALARRHGVEIQLQLARV